MGDRIVIIGGGLAGLSAGCYALRSGYRATIVEHNVALGGVCTAWDRGAYKVDGCIHWLTGGAFASVYEELGISPAVDVRVLEQWATYRDARDGFEVSFTRDLDALVADLSRESPADAQELERVRRGAAVFAGVKPPLEAPELSSLRETLESLWGMRGAVPTLVHFRKPIGQWAREHLTSERLRRLFTRMLPETAPALFLLMVLGYLEKGFLSRPIGGTAAFRDALVGAYRGLGGDVMLHATVDEVLVRNDRAWGVMLSDGRIVEADIVISTASAPETVLHLLGGRFDAQLVRDRLERWKLFEPIVLASYGAASTYPTSPSLLVVDRVEPFDVGGKTAEHLYVRTCNDDPSFAPEGHTVVQAMLQTDYDWWATRSTRYGAVKDEVGGVILAKLGRFFPGLRETVRMIDVATPLTYWNMARSWRGAYEGWMPSADSFFTHVKKTLGGLSGFYMAGQWVEPGGGVPSALLSGRQAVQLMCRDEERAFVPLRATG